MDRKPILSRRRYYESLSTNQSGSDLNQDHVVAQIPNRNTGMLALKRALKKTVELKKLSASRDIEIQFNIDGLPISRERINFGLYLVKLKIANHL